MHVFLYEYATSGGLLSSTQAVPPSIVTEGRAMLEALAHDFATAGDVKVTVQADSRFPIDVDAACRTVAVGTAADERQAFARLARQADWCVIIAPEFDRLLYDRAVGVVESGGRLLGPSPDLIALASDKHQTACHLAAAGIPTPEGRLVEPAVPLPDDFPYPAVLKPVDGAGSTDIRLVSHPSQPTASRTNPYRLERFCPGIPASVAILCGPAGQVPLTPCRQLLTRDGTFRYRGGTLPLPRPLARRAQHLALRTAALFHESVGYLGVDLVLADDVDGRHDAVIEVNPRLTTSYLGLRAAVRQNMASAILQTATGPPCAPQARAVAVRFRSNGRTRISRGVSRA